MKNKPTYKELEKKVKELENLNLYFRELSGNSSITGTQNDFSYTMDSREKMKLKKEAAFQAILESAQDSIFLKDISLKYTYVNPAMERLFQLPASKITGKTDSELFGEESGKHINEIDTRVLNGEIIEDEHTKPVNKVMKSFHVIKVPLRDDKGKIAGLCGIARNITRRKQAEKALIENEKKFKELAELLPQTVFENDINGNITYSNTAGLELFGYTQKDIHNGLNFSQLFITKDSIRLKKIMPELLNNNNNKDNEYIAIKKNDTEFPIQIYSSPIIKDNKVIGLRGTIIDITKQTKVKEELIKAKEKAEESDRLKTAFLANMSHEIRTPMNAIIGISSMLSDTNISKDEKNDFI